MRRSAHWLTLTLLVGCAPRAPALAPADQSVTLSEAAPPNGFVELGTLSVESGKGCGVLGTSGSREDADAKLRNAGAHVGATYVRITSVTEPHPNHQCLEHQYRLRGIAYCADQAPAPVQATAPAPTTTAPAPAPTPTDPPASSSTQ